MSKIIAKWGTRREGNDGYVLEELSIDGHDQRPVVYGPMPAHIVPAFVAGRHRIINTIMTEAGGRNTSTKLIEDQEDAFEVERLMTTSH